MAQFNATIDVKAGPGFRLLLETLRTARATLDLVPEWHTRERKRLLRKIRRLQREIRQYVTFTSEG